MERNDKPIMALFQGFDEVLNEIMDSHCICAVVCQHEIVDGMEATRVRLLYPDELSDCQKRIVEGVSGILEITYGQALERRKRHGQKE